MLIIELCLLFDHDILSNRTVGPSDVMFNLNTPFIGLQLEHEQRNYGKKQNYE